MRVTACDCSAASYRRVRRRWWMRLVWTRRLYRCYSCDRMLLIPDLGHGQFDDTTPLDGEWVPTVVVKGH